MCRTMCALSSGRELLRLALLFSDLDLHQPELIALANDEVKTVGTVEDRFSDEEIESSDRGLDSVDDDGTLAEEIVGYVLSVGAEDRQSCYREERSYAAISRLTG